MRQVFVVDDDSSYTELCEASLRHDHYSVCCFDSVAGALTGLQRSVPDAILLDWRLPDGTGLDVLRWMRLHRVRVPTALVTGLWSAEDFTQVVTEAARLGASRVIRRGIDCDDATEVVSRLLDPLQDDHAALLRGDAAAIDRVAAYLLERLQLHLRCTFTNATNDQIADAVTDATLEYLRRPTRFNPSYGCPLEMFIGLASRRNLVNALRAEKRRRSREHVYGSQTVVSTSLPDTDLDNDPRHLVDLALAREPDPRVRCALRNWLSGDRTFVSWSSVPVLALLPIASKKRAIKRFKDAFVARLKRLATRH